jgi:hypothetical protein
VDIVAPTLVIPEIPPLPDIMIPPEPLGAAEDQFEIGFRKMTSPTGMHGIDPFEIDWKDQSFLGVNNDLLGMEPL